MLTFVVFAAVVVVVVVIVCFVAVCCCCRCACACLLLLVVDVVAIVVLVVDDVVDMFKKLFLQLSSALSFLYCLLCLCRSCDCGFGVGLVIPFGGGWWLFSFGDAGLFPMIVLFAEGSERRRKDQGQAGETA